MTASNMVIPVVMWGREAPTHCISSMLMTPDQENIVTGCNDGHICIWDVDSNWQIHPRSMLLGHTAAVTCMAMGSVHPDKLYFVSSSDNGEMALWDIKDGRCIENTKLQYTHTNIQSHQMMQCKDLRLVCNGYYADIHIMNPLTLEVIATLTSRIQSDWISALCILRPVKREDDVVVAISNSGTVKVWILASGTTENKSQQPIVEEESKQIRCLNAQTLRCCAYNQRTVLIVCSKYWQIYDAGDFSLLCSESARPGERWSGGEFISVDRVVVWSNEGKGYLYKLPTNSNPDHEHFHKKHADPSSPQQIGPQAYTVLDLFMEKPLECSPALIFFFGRREVQSRLLLRGDSEGRIVLWHIPDIHDKKLRLVRQESFDKLQVVHPKCCTSLKEYWERSDCAPEGLIDQLNKTNDRWLQITSSIYMPGLGRLACGRDDGSIVIIPAVEAIILQLLENGKSKDSLSHKVLSGHNGRVNCLLYPCNDSPRYDPSHLVSGGVDFTVILWDMTMGTKLHTFCVHGGEVTQLIVPPQECNPRVLPCVASVASDHSLSLLSLKERKSILLASRQLFPILTVKWRPLDDFLVIGCTDGTVYVWQMETGHLDRVVHGITAEEILNACDIKSEIVPQASTTMLNPTISITQAFKRHNLATFKNFAQQQLQKAQEVLNQPSQQMTAMQHPSLVHQSQTYPMMVQGLRTNLKDPDSHIVYIDTEALIVALLNEDYSTMSPSALEALGFYTNVPQEQGLSDTQKKVADFLSQVKDTAQNVGQKLQQTAESTGVVPVSPSMQRKGGPPPKPAPPGSKTHKPPRPKPPKIPIQEPALSPVMEIAQLFMSCLHAWGLDPDLDKLCMNKLGLLCPKKPISFGLISRSGHMSLLLPSWYKKHQVADTQATASATNGHWGISNAITTHHLLSVIAVTNTLMSMTSATFVAGKQPQRVNPSHPVEAIEPAPPSSPSSPFAEPDPNQQAQTKQGWSLLATLHCVLLPDLIGHNMYSPPQLEMLARRWQDRCLEIREAAQAMLLAELRRIGSEGRKKVVDEWSPYLPSYVDPALSMLTEQQQHQQYTNTEEHGEYEDDLEDTMLGESGKVSQSFESRRKQATAIVMMGVLGAEFGAEIEPSKRKSGEDQQKKTVVEGFGLTKYSHAMHTSKALTFLLLQPPSSKLPANTPIRRAAVDLLGRGFTVWEPYLDVSAVLIGLLELTIGGEKLVPSMTFGLPLCPAADACRTARHALSLIATARPPAFVTTMAKEVARYNAMAQNVQAHQHNLQHTLVNSPLVKAKLEILRVIELLVDKIPNEVVDLLVELMDVTVHCVDQTAVKNKGLQEVFPAIMKFTMVSYCPHTRRICVGARTGGLAFYELKQGKCQILPAHTLVVVAVSFSPDGKYLASYSHHDNKLLFWQTASTSIFSLGTSQTKCVKTFNTPPINVLPNTNPVKIAKLVWIDNRTVVLLTCDNQESRYRV